MKIENTVVTIVAKGRDIILGVKLSKDRRYLYFADTGAGICRVELATGEIEVLTS